MKSKINYHLGKIKAKTRENEILWMCLEIHIANVFEIGKRKLSIEFQNLMA